MPENAAAEGGFGRDAPDRPDDNDRGGAREDKESRAEKAETFDRAMDNANRPDRAPAAPETSTTPDGDNDEPDTRTTDSSDDRSNPAAIPPSSTSPAETDEGGNGNDEQDDRGFFDRAGDFFGGLTQGMQDFSRENPRVDSHGNVVGLVDANGIQRGEVASRVRSSGTSSEDLAAQLGFSSPQDMTAAQNTGFIESKYQEDLLQRAIEAAPVLDERYGSLPPEAQKALDYRSLGYVPANMSLAAPEIIDVVKQAAEMMPDIPPEVWDKTVEVLEEVGMGALNGAALGFAFGTTTGLKPAVVGAMLDGPQPGPADLAAGIGYGIYTGATTVAGAIAGGGAAAIEGLISYNNDHGYHPAPKELQAYPDTKRAKRKTPIEGGGGLRARWTDDNGKIYEWDSKKGTVEVYDKTGKRHLGEFDPNTGEQTGEAKGRGRSVEK
ncbi:MAG: colicin E3/pyocin S6 family cytotoxin [Geminicoccaceae bacterium]